jgi:hypothetical protein
MAETKHNTAERAETNYKNVLAGGTVLQAFTAGFDVPVTLSCGCECTQHYDGSFDHYISPDCTHMEKGTLPTYRYHLWKERLDVHRRHLKMLPRLDM